MWTKLWPFHPQTLEVAALTLPKGPKKVTIPKIARIIFLWAWNKPTSDMNHEILSTDWFMTGSLFITCHLLENPTRQDEIIISMKVRSSGGFGESLS